MHIKLFITFSSWQFMPLAIHTCSFTSVNPCPKIYQGR